MLENIFSKIRKGSSIYFELPACLSVLSVLSGPVLSYPVCLSIRPFEAS